MLARADVVHHSKAYTVNQNINSNITALANFSIRNFAAYLISSDETHSSADTNCQRRSFYHSETSLPLVSPSI